VLPDDGTPVPQHTVDKPLIFTSIQLIMQVAGSIPDGVTGILQ